MGEERDTRSDLSTPAQHERMLVKESNSIKLMGRGRSVLCRPFVVFMTTLGSTPEKTNMEIEQEKYDKRQKEAAAKASSLRDGAIIKQVISTPGLASVKGTPKPTPMRIGL